MQAARAALLRADHDQVRERARLGRGHASPRRRSPRRAWVSGGDWASPWCPSGTPSHAGYAGQRETGVTQADSRRSAPRQWHPTAPAPSGRTQERARRRGRAVGRGQELAGDVADRDRAPKARALGEDQARAAGAGTPRSRRRRARPGARPRPGRARPPRPGARSAPIASESVTTSTRSGGSGVSDQRVDDPALELLAVDAQRHDQRPGPRHRDRLRAQPQRACAARSPARRTRGEGARATERRARAAAARRPLPAPAPARALAEQAPRATGRPRRRRWPGRSRRAARASHRGARRPGARSSRRSSGGSPGPLAASPTPVALRVARPRRLIVGLALASARTRSGTRNRTSSWNAL